MSTIITKQKNFNELFSRLKKIVNDYELDPNYFIVYGSAPLVVHNILDDVNDLDVVICENHWPFRVKKKHSEDGIEFFNVWLPETLKESPEYLISNHSFIYEGIKFVNPNKVLSYKKKLNRKKDYKFLKSLN
jgi:hypothetical protein